MKRFGRRLRRTVSPVFGGVVIWSLFVLITSIIISIEYWEWMTAPRSGSAWVRDLALAAAAVVGLPVALWRSFVAERQVDTLRQQTEIARGGLLSERYQRSAEMLGSDQVWICVAGITGLARLAQNHPDDYHIPVMELLCDFVRHSSRRAEDGEHEEEHDKQDGHESEIFPSPPIKVRAALRAIGSRNDTRINIEEQAGYKLNLEGSDLRGQNLTGLNLTKARFKSANLSGCVLSFANLSEADFLLANLSEAGASEANFVKCNLYCANMVNIDASPLADFSDAHLDFADLAGARLAGAKFYGATFRNTNVSGAVFYEQMQQYRTAAEGLTQKQLDAAATRQGDEPPRLGQLTDHETGQRIHWHRK